MTKKRLNGVGRILLCALICFLTICSLLPNEGGRYALSSVSARADSDDLIRINSYNVEMIVQENRKIDVVESIRVEFLARGLSMFYRSFPTDGARYSNMKATCEGNTDFSYYVADNPDEEGFFDVNCVGGVSQGVSWTYVISYTMEQGTSEGGAEGMILDVIGFGWTVPLNNVNVIMHFPERAEI